jgi:glycosyltransferase involved in cell wall biosynthesis
VRVLLDYRSALRSRSGVGEYTHELVSAIRRGSAPDVDLTIFSSSWKDRLHVGGELNGTKAIDLRIPVTLLNLAWHRLGWPAAETLTGSRFDVTHSLHPLILPARDAAQVVTIHDLNFLKHPERTTREVRRDYPALARQHAARADHIIVNSHFTAGEVQREFGIGADRISVCPPGAPDWLPRASSPPEGYILFVGTLEPRKNVGALLDGYERLLAKNPRVPSLAIAGGTTPQSGPWLDRLNRAPLAGRARHLGYIDPENRRALYEGAAVLVQPSFEEGFGIPVLEAMTIGVPVVAANRGALPEVLGGAGLLVDPEHPESIAEALERLLGDPRLSASCSTRGLQRAAAYRWSSTAATVVAAYRRALDQHAHRN